MADQPEYPGTPRWVKIFGIITIVLVLVFAIVHISGHGIGNHLPSASPGSHGPTESAH